VGAQGVHPPEKVIPIVFLPGIMGSNVKVDPKKAAVVKQSFKQAGREKDYTEKAWAPPNPDGTIVKEFGFGLTDSNMTKQAKKWASFTPGMRQAMLNPDTTIVDDGGKVSAPPWLSGPVGRTQGDKEATRRKWGTVHHFSYSSLLNFLETRLNWMSGPNPVYQFRQLAEEAKKNTAFARDLVPDDTDVSKMLNYQFPVYGGGYNWVQCNKDSAQKVLEWIQEIIKSYQDAKLDCQKVILVTHSMGGLVGRMISKLDKAGVVLGVVHGAMPAIGAPLAYRQMVCGVPTEDKVILSEMRGQTFARLVGQTARETTPVMGQSPGALELLPNHLYNPGWLVVEQKTQQGEEFKLRLPQKDPYTEIYEEQENWYRLVDPAYLDPGKVGKNAALAWASYRSKLKVAKQFHQELGTYYHPMDGDKAGSYLFYGSDPSQKAYGSIRWQLTQVEPFDKMIHPLSPLTPEGIKNAKPLASDPNQAPPQEWKHAFVKTPPSPSGHTISQTSGNLLYSLVFELKGKDVDGDATVPWQSGGAPGKKESGDQPHVYQLKGFDHQSAYDNDMVRKVTLLAVCQIVKKAK
jgi:hypothetical protein